jgi:iron complex transport system substrate-binding protein
MKLREYYFGFSQKNKNQQFLSGAMFQDQWYVPQGESWSFSISKDAQADYLWRDTKGTGASLPFEVILEKAQQAEFWIAPGDFFFFKTNERQQSTL